MPENAWDIAKCSRVEERHDVLDKGVKNPFLRVCQIGACPFALAMQRSDGNHLAPLWEASVVRFEPKTRGGAIGAEVLDAVGGQTGFRSEFLLGESLKEVLEARLGAMRGIGIIPENRHHETCASIWSGLPKHSHDI